MFSNIFRKTRNALKMLALVCGVVCVEGNGSFRLSPFQAGAIQTYFSALSAAVALTIAELLLHIFSIFPCAR